MIIVRHKPVRITPRAYRSISQDFYPRTPLWKVGSGQHYFSDLVEWAPLKRVEGRGSIYAPLTRPSLMFGVGHRNLKTAAAIAAVYFFIPTSTEKFFRWRRAARGTQDFISSYLHGPFQEAPQATVIPDVKPHRSGLLSRCNS